jgi:hypothetical protein
VIADNLSVVAVLAILILPFAGLQPAFNQQGTAFVFVFSQ